MKPKVTLVAAAIKSFLHDIENNLWHLFIRSPVLLASCEILCTEYYWFSDLDDAGGFNSVSW